MNIVPKRGGKRRRNRIARTQGAQRRRNRIALAYETLRAVPDLRPRAILVGQALAWHYGLVYPSQARLAEMTHQSRRTVNSALDDLEEAGLIRRHQFGRGDRRKTAYRLLFMSEKYVQNLHTKPIGIPIGQKRQEKKG